MLHITSKPMVANYQIGNCNYSSIFSELIQAASVCEYYASDIFIDLKAIEQSIIDVENKVYFIGYRDSGVDGNTFIKSRLEQNPHYNYIRLYRLEITSDDYSINVELKRVHESDAIAELNK